VGNRSGLPENIRTGLVTCLRSGFFEVDTEQGLITCRIRGRLKRGPVQRDIIALGDQVSILVFQDGTGVIEEVLPRRKALVRMAPTPRGEVRQVLLANLDQVVFVFACAYPEPHLRMLDRFLVIAEKQGIPALIVANKIDLVKTREAKSIFSLYQEINYPVIYTSAEKHTGIKELTKILSGKISALAGPSGVGKTSPLNSINPELGLKVKEVSEWNERGVHTTVVRRMFQLEGGGYVADLPGLRTLALWDVEAEEIDGYFPEIRGLVSQCQFNDCTHLDEPGCAVRQAVDDGLVHEERYESYLRMRFGED
jgi:ribosome biogenesis GTPase